MASNPEETSPKKGVSIINKALPSFGSDKQLEASIGKQVRIARKNSGVTLQQLSKQSLLSASMLSKIENGQISASLKTIQLICHALNISITSLFKQHDKDVEPTFIKSGDGLTIERAGSDEGRHYQLLGHTVDGAEGMTDFGEVGYGGPAPPDKRHTYVFKLYALDTKLDLPDKSTKSDVEKAMEGHIIEQTQLTGKIGRAHV